MTCRRDAYSSRQQARARRRADNNYSNYSVKNAKQLEKLLEAWQK